ncbi:hypothetical protein J3R30DRAFT_3412899 [Lentinula aciculospora]|uniref:Uncharacterized protein n=1 Tax=Lentinula aciculospora TaxID=153920 RepID=A0A9W8ZTH1_9AGAR|nr:hypothetical protein J3R30DRAFT_3412899 [Lentinula aciculospora]
MSTKIKSRISQLNEDLSNWIIHKQCLITEVTSYGLAQNLNGLIWITPKKVVKHDNKFYLGDSTKALSNDKFNKLLEEQDTYDTKEAQDKPTAHDTWILLCSTAEVKSHISIDSLQTPKDGNICESLSQLQVWYEELAGMGFKVPNDSYMTHICQACGSSYCDLFKSIDITAKLTGVSLTSNFLINSAQLAATE